MSGNEPLEQDEGVTLDAELRRAIQHRRAAQERAAETREELRLLLERAREILEGASGHPSQPSASEQPGEDLTARTQPSPAPTHPPADSADSPDVPAT